MSAILKNKDTSTTASPTPQPHCSRNQEVSPAPGRGKRGSFGLPFSRIASSTD